MRIEELDEYQGITQAMVIEWLASRGYSQERPSSQTWLKEGGPFVVTYRDRSYLPGTLDQIVRAEVMSPQDLLREINPRMRPWPSAEARRGHSGLWLVTVSDDETGAIGRFGDEFGNEGWFHFNDSNILTEHEKFARYWPCDANGNKIRWPTDEHGNLL